MHYIITTLSTIMTSLTWIQQAEPIQEKPWTSYGYIALGVIILILIIIVLVRKQYRRFNE